MEIFKEKDWCFRKYDGRRKEFRGISRAEFEKARDKAIHRRYTYAAYEPKSLLRRCFEAVVECAKPEHGRYQKIAMYGHTWLYLCSPIYGHSDYNKSRLMPIKGNEKACEFLIRVSDHVAGL